MMNYHNSPIATEKGFADMTPTSRKMALERAIRAEAEKEGTEIYDTSEFNLPEPHKLSEILSIPTLEKVIQLSESLNRSHQQMQECHNALKSSLRRQNEIRAYYQSLVKHLTSQKETEHSQLADRIAALERENDELKRNTAQNEMKNKTTLVKVTKRNQEQIEQFAHQASKECKRMRLSLSQMRKEVSLFPSLMANQFDSKSICNTMKKIISKNFGEDANSEWARLSGQLEYVTQKYQSELALRKRLQNDLIEEKGNIRVFCRIRPFIKNEKKETALKIISEETVSVSLKNGKVRSFDMDVVHSMSSSQEDVFEDVKHLLASVVDGYNVCILAYGQTGSGKTYTMEGTPDSPGVIPRALHELFSIMRQKQELFNVRLSMTMVEIYNNDIRDLLVSKNSANRKIEYADVGEGGLEVKNVTVVDVQEINEVLKYIRKGSANRTEATTQMNSNSSRSHSIVTIEVECQQTERGRQKLGFAINPTRAKLRLVDLAGSECVGMSGVTGEAQQEASYVNRSLCALGDVMKALSTPSRTHIPYRNSRLTHFLQDSLGGDAKMAIFVNISPTLKCLTETSHSLSFGSRVRHINRGKAQKHIINVNK